MIMKNKVLPDGIRCVNNNVLSTLSRIVLHRQFWLWRDSFPKVVICSQVEKSRLTGPGNGGQLWLTECC